MEVGGDLIEAHFSPGLFGRGTPGHIQNGQIMKIYGQMQAAGCEGIGFKESLTFQS